MIVGADCDGVDVLAFLRRHSSTVPSIGAVMCV